MNQAKSYLTMNENEITSYLSSIKLDNCAANLEGLKRLQAQHMENMLFENLDIIVGRKIALDTPHLFDKMILKKRGGYCFELNTLYAELLKSLGFFPQPVLGRVWLSNPKSTPPRNHLALLVKLEGKTYVTDVGFGGLVSRIPLNIHVATPIKDKDGLVRIIPFRDHQFMIQRQTTKGWSHLYSFETVEISEEDISISNYYMSTNPNSHFFYHKFVGKNTVDGRIALFNNKISFRKGVQIMDKRRVAYGQDWLDILADEFSLLLDFSEGEMERLFELDRG